MASRKIAVMFKKKGQKKTLEWKTGVMTIGSDGSINIGPEERPELDFVTGRMNSFIEKKISSMDSFTLSGYEIECEVELIATQIQKKKRKKKRGNKTKMRKNLNRNGSVKMSFKPPRRVTRPMNHGHGSGNGNGFGMQGPSMALDKRRKREMMDMHANIDSYGNRNEFQMYVLERYLLFVCM